MLSATLTFAQTHHCDIRETVLCLLRGKELIRAKNVHEPCKGTLFSRAWNPTNRWRTVTVLTSLHAVDSAVMARNSGVLAPWSDGAAEPGVGVAAAPMACRFFARAFFVWAVRSLERCSQSVLLRGKPLERVKKMQLCYKGPFFLQGATCTVGKKTGNCQKESNTFVSL